MGIEAMLFPLITTAAVLSGQNPPVREPLRLRPFLQLHAFRYTAREGLPAGEAASVWLHAGKVYARMAQTEGQPGVPVLVTLDGDRWKQVSPETAQTDEQQQQEALSQTFGGRILSSAKSHDGLWWIVTDKGAFRQEGAQFVPLTIPRRFRHGQLYPHPDTEIRSVLSDRAGHIWLATSTGAYATDGADWWQPINREDGMPYEDLLCLAFAPNGDQWGGTSAGAWRLRNGEWRYFWGKRWMPGNRVNAIACAGDGSVWLATDGGVAKIEERRMSLEQKAAHMEEITAARHNRRGWVTGCNLKTPGDPNGGFIHEASDNDGLWTAFYVSAEAFRYAVTRDPAARKLAKQSMEALLDLVRLSGYPGFPARAIIRKGEEVLGFDPNETVRVAGETDKIWYTSPVDPNLLIKGDTSSDELDGHYFAWYIYHELAADAKEKKEIQKVVAAVTDNLLRNEFTLVGHTGRKTRWGVFGPQYLNEDPLWVEERGLNSIELLCYLRVAYHICKDKRYLDAYETLISRHHYLLNTLLYRRGAPWYAINHSDDELAYLVYYPLLMLETDPHRRAILRQSIGSTWNGGPITAGIREENAPFYSVIYGAVTGESCRVEEAVQTLQEWPWEQINWTVQNSHRHDVTFRVARGIRRPEIDRVLPASERRVMRWNGNPWTPDHGDDGRSEEDGAAWLLPYWMARYHKLIVE